MRIAFFNDASLHQTNGVAVTIVGMAKELANRGHRIYIFTPKHQKEKELYHPNVIMKYCPAIPAFFNRDFGLTLPFDTRILNLIKDEKIELIHLHTPLILGLQAIVIAKLLRLPLVGTYHTFFAHSEYLKRVGLNNRLVEKIAWKVSNLYYNQCDLITCPSEGAKEELLAHKCRKVITVIPYGVDGSIFDNSKSSGIREKFGRKNTLLLSVSRIAPEKNVLSLIKCFSLVLKKISNAKLILIGGGPLLNKAREITRELGIENRVVITGQIEHDKLAKSGIFGACNLFVLASRTETGPLAVLEAQANGLVCVVAKGKGMKLVEDGVNGYIADPNDKQAFANAIVRLLTNRREYVRMKKATLHNIKKYEFAHVIDLWEKTYAKLIKVKKKSISDPSSAF